ncbi:MAG: hypothetical protein GY898_01845 [Proteobacteria bacterium]|nr:hypothetical protein [Pseudomonadota bacterium]
MMIRRIAFALTALTAVALTGCAAPCDQYCDTSADYIEYCLENGTQGPWTTAAASGGFEVWGTSSRDEYADACKDDMKNQLSAHDADTLTGACTDDANQFTEWVERGTCIDLP